MALKRLLGGSLASETAVARFRREVEAAAALDHPNIVTLFGFEVLDGHPMLVMQWVNGVPIDEWSRGRAGRAPPSLNERLAVFLKLCDAVQHAHQRGVIHRDLKPGNILVDDDGTPKILDFGLAKFRDDRSTAGVTHTGDFLGTPAYAAPEQVAGDLREIDTRTDQYALGVVLFELLTGALPYPIGENTSDTLAAIRNIDARRPSRLNSRLPRDLDAIVLKALEKDRERRYPSIDAFASDIRRFQCGDAVQAAAPSRIYRMSKFVRRHRWPVGLGAAATLSIAATAAIAVMFAVNYRIQLANTESARASEERSRSAAQRDSRVSRAINGVLTDMLQSANAWSGTTGRAARDVRVADVLASAAANLDRGALAADPVVEASVRQTLGGTFEALGLFDDAAEQWSRAVALRTAVIDGPTDELAHAVRRLAHNLCSAGRFDEGQAHFERAIALYESARGPDGVELARTLQWSANQLLEQGRTDDAARKLDRALAMIVDSDSMRAALLNSHAAILETRHDYVQAAAEYAEALAILRKLHTTPHPDVASALSNLANVKHVLGAVDEARSLVEEAIRISRARFGDDHPDLTRSLQVAARQERDPAARH